MSTRWYPLYQKGNPQLRIFLPNFWMKLISLGRSKATPPNVVHFECSMEMTKFDIQQYLEKIYGIPIINVRTFIRTGKFRKALGKNYIVKNEDEKIAVVTMPVNEKFTFPDLFPTQKDEMDKHLERLNEGENNWKKSMEKFAMRPGIPKWFSI